MDRRATRLLIWIALTPPLLTGALLLSLIRGQGVTSPDVLRAPFVAAFLLLMPLLLLVSLVRRLNPLVRIALRGAGATGLLVFGVFAMFSIGLPIFLCGALATIAFFLSMERKRWRSSLLAGMIAAALSVLVLLGGFDLSNRVIVCPETGESGGSGFGFLNGPYHWSCVNGHLTWSSG